MKITAFFGKETAFEVSENFNLLAIDPAGAQEGKITFSFPVADVHSYWVSHLTAPCERIPWVISVDIAAQRRMPFITFFNTKGTNQLAAGLVDCFCDLLIDARMNQESCCYDVAFILKGESALPQFKFSLDLTHTPWQKSVDAWRKALTPGKYHFPEAVWNPVYCTWYAVHGAMTEAWCDRAAAEAKKLGFGTFILDDGWCYPDMKRVSPSTITSWYEKVGDWTFDPVKFPDAAAHIKRVQELGLKYLVWVAPYLIGAKSKACEELKAIPGSTFGDYLEGYYKLDTRCEKACSIMLDRMEKVMSQYELDGLKVDFLDQIYTDMENPKSESCVKFTAELSKRIRKHNPEAMIEFRQSYATPQMLSYGTQFRAGDCPFDFILNFRRIAHIRLAVGDGIPVHADPAYWPATELPVNIARHFIAMMAGVPMLSIDLESLSDSVKKIIAFWVFFYQRNSYWLRSAHWEFDYSSGLLGAATATAEGKTLAIVADAKRVPEFKTPGWLLNLSPETIKWNGCKAFNYDGLRVAGDVIPLGGGAWRD